jgi:hypothetical protein
MRNGFLFVVLSASSCCATSITSAVTCMVGGVTTTDNHYCESLTESALAEAAAGYSSSTSGGILAALISGYAVDESYDRAVSVAASSSVNYDLTLTSAGPIRSGFLTYTWGYFSVSAINKTSASINGSHLQYTHSDRGAEPPITIPISLGVDIDVLLSGSFTCPIFPGPSGCGLEDEGFFGGDLTIQLNEVSATGGIGDVVSVEYDPEPSPIKLIVIGGALVCGLSIHRKRRRGAKHLFIS